MPTAMTATLRYDKRWPHTTRRPWCCWKPPRSYGNGEHSSALPDGVCCIFPAEDAKADVPAEQSSACQRKEKGDEGLQECCDARAHSGNAVRRLRGDPTRRGEGQGAVTGCSGLPGRAC